MMNLIDCMEGFGPETFMLWSQDPDKVSQHSLQTFAERQQKFTTSNVLSWIQRWTQKMLSSELHQQFQECHYGILKLVIGEKTQN